MSSEGLFGRINSGEIGHRVLSRHFFRPGLFRILQSYFQRGPKNLQIPRRPFVGTPQPHRIQRRFQGLEIRPAIGFARFSLQELPRIPLLDGDQDGIEQFEEHRVRVRRRENLEESERIDGRREMRGCVRLAQHLGRSRLQRRNPVHLRTRKNLRRPQCPRRTHTRRKMSMFDRRKNLRLQVSDRSDRPRVHGLGLRRLGHHQIDPIAREGKRKFGHSMLPHRRQFHPRRRLLLAQQTNDPQMLRREGHSHLRLRGEFTKSAAEVA